MPEKTSAYQKIDEIHNTPTTPEGYVHGTRELGVIATGGEVSNQAKQYLENHLIPLRGRVTQRLADDVAGT